MEVDDTELMELMDHCEASGDHQHEQQEAASLTHIQQTEPEQARTAPENPPQSESCQGWNKPTMQVTEREAEGSIIQHGGGKKSQEGQKDEAEKEEERKNGSEMQEESKRGVWGQRVCHTHERAVPMQDTVEELDITEEGEKVAMMARQ